MKSEKKHIQHERQYKQFPVWASHIISTLYSYNSSTKHQLVLGVIHVTWT